TWLLDSAPKRTDDALRHARSARQSQGVADGHHPVADLKLPRIAELRDGQVVTLDLEHRQVGLRVGTDNFAGETALIWQRYEDLLGAFDNVVVGQNVPLAVVDDARPNTGGHDKRLVELARLDFLLVGDLDHC